MSYKLVNKWGQKITPATFKTKEQARKYKQNKEKIVGKMPNARIVKTNPKKKSSNSFGFSWAF